MTKNKQGLIASCINSNVLDEPFDHALEGGHIRDGSELPCELFPILLGEVGNGVQEKRDVTLIEGRKVSEVDSIPR